MNNFKGTSQNHKKWQGTDKDLQITIYLGTRLIKHDIFILFICMKNIRKIFFLNFDEFYASIIPRFSVNWRKELALFFFVKSVKMCKNWRAAVV